MAMRASILPSFSPSEHDGEGRNEEIAASTASRGTAVPHDIAFNGAPAIIGTIAGMSVQDLFVSGDQLFVSSNLGLRIYDLTLPASPALLGSLAAASAGTGQLCVAGNRAYTMSGDGLRVLDVSNALAPAPLGFLAESFYSNPADLTIDGERVYVVARHEAYWCMVDLYDVSQPSAPKLVGSCRLPNGFDSRLGIALAGSTLFAVGERLWTIDVDPAQRSAAPIGFVDTPGSALEVAVSGTHAYVADQSKGVQIVDISNPSAPAKVGEYISGQATEGVAVSGSYAYVADHGGLLGEPGQILCDDLAERRAVGELGERFGLLDGAHDRGLAIRVRLGASASGGIDLGQAARDRNPRRRYQKRPRDPALRAHR